MTILLIAAAIVAIAATIRAIVTDGYHRIPTCRDAEDCLRTPSF